MAKEPEKGALDFVGDDEFETVVEESGTKIEFPDVGAQFVGVYTGTQFVIPEGKKEDDGFNKHFFRDANGNVKFVLGGFKLNDALGQIETGTKVRITYTGEVPMAKDNMSPMKDYRVEASKNRAVAGS